MKKYFNNVIVTLLIAITVSSLSACASKTAASQTAPEKQTNSTYPQAEIPVPYIDLRDYTQKPDLEKLFEGYTEDYAYAFREAKYTDGGGGYLFYGLPLRQAMSLNGGDILILFDDEDWKAMQETTVDIVVDILIIVQSSKRYFNSGIKATVSKQNKKSFFYFVNHKHSKDPLEKASSLDLILGK